MGRASPALSAFNGGEFAPEMEGRTDIDKYPIATHIQQNFVPTKQGPSTYRPGTVYVQPVKNSAQKTWLVRFEFSQTQAFQLEFGDKYIRFYANHGPVLATGVTAYSGATPYVIGNLALQGGIIYYCIAPTTGNAPPNGTFWYALTPYNGSATQAIYEIPTPYSSADLTDSFGEFTLQCVQSGDVLYIAGGSAGTGPSGLGYPPYTLTRFSNSPPNWQLAAYSPTDGPFSNQLPLPLPGSQIALTASAVTGIGVLINAYGGNVFAATDVGRLIRIQSQYFNTTPWQGNAAWTTGQSCTNNGNNYLALTTGTSGANAPVTTNGSQLDGPAGVRWLYTDSGYGIARITAYNSPTQVTVTVLSAFPLNVVNAVFTITGATQANPCVLTVVNTAGAGQSAFVVGVVGMTQLNNTIFSIQAVSGTTITLAAVNATAYGAYVSGGSLILNATTEWQLGAWSNTTEWPRAASFFKDRLFWAGKINVWGSVPGLYTSHAQDFFGQQTTDSGINVLVSGTDTSSITWLSSANILLIGTQGGEYGLDAANYSTAPLGPQNVEVLRQSNWRCRNLPPLLVGVSVLYVQRAGRKIFAMDYNFYLNRYDSTDQSKFAYHLSVGGLTAMAFMQEPWSVLWVTRADGTLLSYTFNREDNVTAWARHNLGGNGACESVSVIPSPDSLRDELWMIVSRTVNGAQVRSVEYMAKSFEGPRGGQTGDAQSSAWYVDCGGTITVPGGTTTVSVPWLVGETVSILADGGVQPQQSVPAGGMITLQASFTTVTVGLPYQGNIVPMRPEGGADVGTAQGKLKDGNNLVIRLVDSGGGTLSQLSNQNATTQTYEDPLGLTSLIPITPEQIRYNDTQTPLDSPPSLQSGDFPISFPGDSKTDQDDRDFYILVQQTSPLPLTVVGLYPSYDVAENQ